MQVFIAKIVEKAQYNSYDIFGIWLYKPVCEEESAKLFLERSITFKMEKKASPLRILARRYH